MTFRFFKNDLKRAFCNMGFLVATALLMAILVHGIGYIGGDVSTYEAILNAMALSGFSPFAAVFPSMGYSVTFCEEYRSGYMRMISSRMSWKKYGIVRIMTVALSGGVVIALPIAVVCMIAYVKGAHYTPDFYEGKMMEYYLEQYGDAYILVGKVILGFLFGAMWALVGLAFSVWFCNRYVSLIAPFVLYELMWILLYDIPILNPIFMIRGDTLNSYPLSAIMESLYIIIAIVAVWLGLRWRMRHE